MAGEKRGLEAGAQELGGSLGKTVQRLRKAYALSISDLSEASGVAKSIISQIERNETNPTLATVWRLSQALDVGIGDVLGQGNGPAGEGGFVEKLSRAETPVLVSEDGKVRLAIVGWIRTVEWLQWYDVSAEPGGLLEADGHQRGSVESLSVLAGRFSVEVDGELREAGAGETLRYRCDRPHHLRCLEGGEGGAPGRATMVCMLRMASPA